MDATIRSPVTAALVEHLEALGREPLAPEAATVGKQCLMDWLGVALAARAEPAVTKVVDALALGPGAPGEAAILGLARRARADDAALVNGTMGHALDFDDVLAVMGHPTAPIAPALLALAEATGASGDHVLTAFVVGVEAAARVGALMGPSHYERGWHGTATFGAFGAAAAAATLLRLDARRTAHALGLAGTQAAGLKSVFGTMSKPFHAGRAAQAGVLAARLAAAGFTSDTDILGSRQGFADTQSATADPAAGLAPRALPHIVDVLFKHHAACYLTHNAIEAAGELRSALGLRPDDIAEARVAVMPMHLGVCDIEAPASGLECKFSLRMACALAFAGEDTADEAVFSDATAAREDLQAFCRRVAVEATAASPATQVTVRLRDGSTHAVTADVSTPARDLEAQQAKLERKFRQVTARALSAADAEAAILFCRDLDRQPTLRPLIALCAGVGAPRPETPR
ncbi:MmgE/PrpD family protein [Phenylobacterium sp.]|uniref:MmgE/PrpD family protein n=1 Tax=Phenylobacterium sp. TaxID=1871053 RepID=UPI00301D02C7